MPDVLESFSMQAVGNVNYIQLCVKASNFSFLMFAAWPQLVYSHMCVDQSAADD